LRGLRKDNTGYDLKHLFIGAEGTLGIITAAVLKLFPRPHSTATAWAAVPSPDAALQLLSLLKEACGDRLTAFELISRNSLDLVLRHVPDTRDPFSESHDWYVLAELSDLREDGEVRKDQELSFTKAIESGFVSDVVIAENEKQAHALWRMRESIPEAARGESGMVYRHDISVAVSRVPAFIKKAQAALEQRFPNVYVICFGHLGDGNLHYNAFIPGRDRADSEARDARDVAETVYDIVQTFDGSFSAEHGIGLYKVPELKRYKDPLEIELMQTVKRALDPHGIMNPGKVL